MPSDMYIQHYYRKRSPKFFPVNDTAQNHAVYLADPEVIGGDGNAGTGGGISACC